MQDTMQILLVCQTIDCLVARCTVLLRWPNFLGSEDAPATANRDEEKKTFAALSMSSSFDMSDLVMLECKSRKERRLASAIWDDG